MGQMAEYRCRNCGFDAEIGENQPYHVFSGSLTDKYCPKIEKIVTVFEALDGSTKIACQDEIWQEEFGVPRHCQGCKAEGLKAIEMASADEENVIYKCPRCGSNLDDSCIFSICYVD